MSKADNITGMLKDKTLSLRYYGNKIKPLERR